MFKIIKDYSKGYRLPTVLTPIFILFESLLDTLIPTMMSYIVDVAGAVATGSYDGASELWNAIFLRFPALGEPNSTLLLWVLGALCVVMALLGVLTGALAGRTVAVAGAGFAANLRVALFEKIQGFSFANIDKFSTAGLVTRCTTDINNAQQCFMQLIRTVVRAPLMLIMATIFAFRIDREISWVYLIAVPVLAIFMVLLSLQAYPRFKKMLGMYDNMNSFLQEDLSAIRVVKAFVREDYQMEKFDDSADAVRRAHLSAEKLMVLANPFSSVVMYGTIIVILYFGGGKLINGDLKSGALTSLISYSTQILMSVMMVCFIIVQMVLSRASIQRINEALYTKSDIVDGNSCQEVTSGSIVFRHVDFSYSNSQDNLTLSDIDFEIKSGETVGIIGGTGEGKTSLVQLIPRFYDALNGEILVDGLNVKDYDLTKLRDGVSMVLQKNVLFSGSIESNLRWGNENATMEQIEEACRIAQADEFVKSFPDGYQTDLGQGGVNVSGGQKQRLCIARALLKRPKIMILDDSTSAVDTATDAKIREGLKKLDKDMTVIIIAQRLSSVENCDKIIVLSEGKVNAIGNHETLLQTNKIYQEVYHSQQKGVAESSVKDDKGE